MTRRSKPTTSILWLGTSVGLVSCLDPPPSLPDPETEPSSSSAITELGESDAGETGFVGSSDHAGTVGEDTGSVGTADTEPAGSEGADEGNSGGDLEVWCEDHDRDGFGDPESCVVARAAPEGFVNDGEDCNDGDSMAHPGAAPHDDLTACMQDRDADGYGDIAPDGVHVTAGTDCDDDSGVTFPGSAEIDDAAACMTDLDNDGYGEAQPPLPAVAAGTDCNDTTPAICAVFEDPDGDGFGHPGYGLIIAQGDPIPAGYADNDLDCLDHQDAEAPPYQDIFSIVFPGNAPQEASDGCYIDSDADGYGASLSVLMIIQDSYSGTFPSYPVIVDLSRVDAGLDCADIEPYSQATTLHAATYPGAAFLEDAGACMADLDGDGWGSMFPMSEFSEIVAGSDCYDEVAGAYIFPGSAELEVDAESLCTLDYDGDGYGDDDPPSGQSYMAPIDAGTDCDDGNAVIWAGC